MRDEIEKLIEELRGEAAEQQLGQLAQLFDGYADRLQAILNDSEAESSALSDSKESDKLDALEALKERCG